jgi:acyl-CoA thioester hydrolase
MPKNSIEFEIEFGETDTAGRVFYPNYFRWFDRGTHLLLGTIGCPHTELLEKFHYAQPVIDCGCKVIRPLYYGDKVRLETSVSEVNESTFKVEHLVFRNNELAGTGFELRVWVKTAEGGSDGRLKVISIPTGIVEKLKGEAEDESELENLLVGVIALD